MIKSLEDTITAIGTRPGESAIGIVKLSGREAISIANSIFRTEKMVKIKDLKTYSMAYGHIIDKEGQVIDEALVSVMKEPRSYTREDTVEINCHGGLAATSKVLEMCIKSGARIADPGEFTKRAFLNGRIDLSQAEAVVDLVKSKTEQCLKIAAKNLDGGIRKKVTGLKKMILNILVQLEASIDFIEEDLETAPYNKLCMEVKKIYGEISELIKDEEKGEIVKNGVRVAIVGKTNVGKSSLLNLLSRKEKAIVTEIPGTTRDAIEEILYIEGIPLILVDTAGIRKSRDTIEKIGVERSLKHINEADLIIFVIDGSRKIDNTDRKIMDRLKGKNVILCINKKDLKLKINLSEFEKVEDIDEKIHISALKGDGLKELEDSIKRAVFNNGEINLVEKVIINKRQKSILIKTIKCLGDAKNAMERELSEEFPSSDLRIAYDLLGEITGETIKEDILEHIFSKFCIGK